MRSAIPIQLGLAMFACLGSASTASAQQGVTYRWIDPNGGIYQDPSNWTPEGTPKGGDNAVFDLLDSYLVSTSSDQTGGSLGSLLITKSDVEFLITGSSPSLVRADFLSIGSFQEDPSFPGRFELRRADPTSPFSGLRVDDLRVGTPTSSGPFFGSKFTSGPSTSVEIEGSIEVITNATLAFLLGVDEPASSSARISVLGTGKIPSVLEGTLDIGPDKNELPPIGSVRTLLQGDLPFFGPNGYPSLELVVLRPTPGRSIAVEASFPFGVGGATIESRIDFADSVTSIDFSEESTLGAAPTGLEAADLTGDGRDDLVVLLADGTVRVYPSSASGGFGTPAVYAIGAEPRDVSTGDFDDDGTVDLAIVCGGDDSLRFLLNPSQDVAALVTGPIEILDDSPVGSATTTFFVNPLERRSARGVSVTTKGSNGGTVTLYRIDGVVVTKVGRGTDVGDDPGTTDPIDDEGKKDDTAPIGVGGVGATARSAGRGFSGPVLFVLDLVASGDGYPYELTNTIPLSGYPIDFVSKDIDNDTVTETFVLTDTGQLDLLEIGVSIRRPVGSFDLQGTPTAIAIAQLDGDSGPDDPSEIVIGFDSPPRIDVYRVQRARLTEGRRRAGFLAGRYVFERVLTRSLDETPIDVAASDARAKAGDGAIYVGSTGDGGPAINIGDYDAEEIPRCVYADLDGNGVVSGFDLSILLGSWGPCTGCIADINQDGIVDSADIGLLFVAWGPCEL